MLWTWEIIRDEWLGEGRVATPGDEVVAAFETVEQLLGPEWMESQRGEVGGARVKGSIPVAAIISMARRLNVARHAAGFGDLVDRIRSGDDAARAELTAAYLCVANGIQVQLEFGVAALVGERQRTPDFRLRRGMEPWLYVEVAAPDVSDLQRQAHAVLEQLSAALAQIPFGLTVEIMLRRDPTDVEVQEILSELRTQLQVQGPSQRDLPSLALILIGHAEPGTVVLDSHGEPNVPRIGVSKFEVRGEARKHIVLRYAFSDQRAEAFLTSEARQLPRDALGLVMIDPSRAVGGFRTWEPLLARRLQPAQHTRVSAIVLFTAGMFGLADGEAWIPWTNVIENRYAVRPAPVWLVEKLRSWRVPNGGT